MSKTMFSFNIEHLVQISQKVGSQLIYNLGGNYRKWSYNCARRCIHMLFEDQIVNFSAFAEENDLAFMFFFIYMTEETNHDKDKINDKIVEQFDVIENALHSYLEPVLDNPYEVMSLRFYNDIVIIEKLGDIRIIKFHELYEKNAITIDEPQIRVRR